MKYLLTTNNHKPDYAYENALYFNQVIERDNYISTYLFNGDEWRNQITKSAIKSRVKQDGSGELVINEPEISMSELYKKNYIILRDCEEADPEFFFITNIDNQKDKQYILTIQKDLIMSYPGFLKNTGQLELNEGHVNDGSLLDVVLDGGYKKAMSINPLERDRTDIPLIEDYGLIDNQWLYVFIAEQDPASNFPLFKLNDQIQPYRVLAAPLNPVIVKDNSEVKTLLSNVNEIWNSVYYFHNEEINVEDNDIRGDQSQLELERVNTLLTPAVAEKGDIKISYSYTKTGMSNVNNIIEIPFEKWDLYEDNWFPVYIGATKGTGEYKILNNQLWQTSNKEIPGYTTDDKYDNIVAFEMKWSSLTNKIEMRALKRGRTPSNTLDALKAKGFGGWKRIWVTAIPGGWAKIYAWGRSGGSGGSQKNSIPYNEKQNSNVKWPYMIGETGSFSTGVTTYEWNKPVNWNFTIKEVYQGTDTGQPNATWDSSSLLNYINLQSIAQDDAKETLISAKVSSFNPLELNEKGFPINLKNKDAKTGPVTPADWKNGDIYEIFEQNTELNPLFNTYDLSQYSDKSWLRGLNNYSIMIENNKEFDISPEYVYSEGKFQHDVIISPTEWTERIKWPNSLHTSELEYVNNKEVLFAINAFNDYQANNPGVLDNQTANNNSNLLAGLLSGGLALGAAVAAPATGGASLILGAGAGVGIGKTAINDRKNRRNQKANIAKMKQQPAISSGSGNAYGDLYLNRNAFGLTLVEWQYQTNKAPTLIDQLTKYGQQFENSLQVNFEQIKRPEFNYVKVTNGLSSLGDLDMNNPEKQQLSDILEAGTRLWYNPKNYLNYDIENNSIFKKDMINYINWNSVDNTEQPSFSDKEFIDIEEE